jgi:hypothetical protein
MAEQQILQDESYDQFDNRLTMVAGAVIEADYVYIAQYFDRYQEDWDDLEMTRLSQVDVANSQHSWGAHDRPWKIIAVCVWRNVDQQKRLYVALAAEGDVEIMGPGGTPMIVEHINGAGLFRPWSKQLGYLNQIRQIGNSLFACGGANQVYMREQDDEWKMISEDILVDPNLIHTRDDPMAGIRFISDVNGLSEDAVYTAGENGEVYFYDGENWLYVNTDTDAPLLRIAIIDPNDIFICGADGILLRGNKENGFRSVWPLEEKPYFTGIEYYNSIIWLASTRRGIYTFDPKTGRAELYQTEMYPEFVDPHRLEAKDGVLWCFGFKDLAYFDGHVWTRVHHPDNPRIGD